MRVLSGLFLLVLVVAIAILAFENNRETTVKVFDWQKDLPLPLLIGGVYVLGMLSGWSLIGMVKRSWQRVTEPDHARV